jgi:hypothetical protein
MDLIVHQRLSSDSFHSVSGLSDLPKRDFNNGFIIHQRHTSFDFVSGLLINELLAEIAEMTF